jgi:hypothetical protein
MDLFDAEPDIAPHPDIQGHDLATFLSISQPLGEQSRQ